MKDPFARRYYAAPDVQTALRRDKIGWDHDPHSGTLMMPRSPRVSRKWKGGA